MARRMMHDSESEDDGPRSVPEYGLLKVGGSYAGGTILELYPDVDRVTVAFARGLGTEIQHLKISKVTAKLAAGPGSFDTMD